MLLRLPPEVLAIVFDYVVHDAGIRHGVLLRTVCRGFDEYILDAVYALPAFDNLNNYDADSPGWDLKMSKTMVADLISRKLKNHPDERALAWEILSTASFIKKALDNVDCDSYINTLVFLAADNLPLCEIINGLSRGFCPQVKAACLLENALAAAICLDQTSHIQALMELGAEARGRTKWFSDVLHLAATYTSPRTFIFILDKVLTTEDQFQKRFAASRLVMALDHAALQGKADIFCADLWACIEETYDQSSIHEVFEPAMKSATLSTHGDVVLAIFDLSKSFGKGFVNKISNGNWIEILRLAASNGSEEIARVILNETAAVSFKGGLNLPLEDACRNGHAEIVKLLIAHHTKSNLSSYRGSIYWAAREAHYDILSFVLQAFAPNESLCLADALCGAFAHGIANVTSVCGIAAEVIPVKKPLRLDGKTFAQMVDVLFEDYYPRESGPCKIFYDVQEKSSEMSEDDMLLAEIFDTPRRSEEQNQLSRACFKGNFSAVQHIVAQCGAKSCSPSAFGGAIVSRHPGILQFLCEKFPDTQIEFGYVSNNESTAIFQILLDNGWVVNPKLGESSESILNTVRHSEELVRWFLSHGSDANYRSGWDITPLSTAISFDSLSTIRLMFHHGADPRKGQLLHFTTERYNLDQLAIIDMLLSFGATLDARKYENDPSGWRAHQSYGMGTPLHLAAELGKDDVVAYLLWRGASCKVLDSIGRTALDIAKQYNHDKIVELIEGSFTRTNSVTASSLELQRYQ